jgi:hypothetical protein
VSLSSGIQVHPDAAHRQSFLRERGLEDLFYPDKRIRDLGEREGFPVLMLGPLLQRQADRQGVFFHGFDDMLGWGHWNERGHEWAGERVAHWIAPWLGGTVPASKARSAPGPRSPSS